MIIAVASDAHGARRKMDALLTRLPAIDALCFLGDMDRDAEYLSYGLSETQPRAAFYAVAGNNDPFSRRPLVIEMFFEEIKTLITHGHVIPGIRSDTAGLVRRARGDDCALALYGHTHVQRDESIDGVRLVNPGALMRAEYALLTLRGSAVEAALCTLEG